MITKACREKHIYSYSPSTSPEVRGTVKDLQRLYDMQGYTTMVDISTQTISLTATRIVGVEEGEEE